MRSAAGRGTAIRAGFGTFLAVLLGIALALSTVVPMARAAGTVDLTITAATKSGAALAGVTITAIPVANSAPDPSKPSVDASAITGRPGVYELLGLEEDVPYAIYFRSVISEGFDQFLGGSPWIDEAEYWTATEPGPAALDVTLATNSAITGKVTNASRAAVKSVTVTAYRFNGSTWDWFDETSTAATGIYTLRNIDPGSYKLEFSHPAGVNYQTTYSGNTSTFASATPIYVGLGATVGFNAVVATGGVIAGAVTFKFPPGPNINSTVAFPADGIKAYAYRLNDGVGFTGINWSAPYFESRVTVISNKVASWSVMGLPAGRYVVKLYDHQYGDLAERWVSTNPLGTALVSAASIFTVTAGRTTAAPATTLLYADQHPTPAVTITVRDEASQPVVGADVVVFSNDDEDFYGSGGDFVTNASGQVSILRLPIGSYDVLATHPDQQTTKVVRTIVSTSAATWSVTMADRGPFDFTEAATATGPDLKVGSTFTVNAETTLDDGVGLDADVHYSYQWYRAGQPIFGGTQQTYVAQPADVGKELTVIVRVKQDLDQFFSVGYSILGTATVGTIVQGDAPVNSSAPWISSPSAALPGVVLTANSGVWSLTGLHFAYQWYRDGDPIVGATARTYALTPGDGGVDELTVEVTASKPGHAAAAPLETSPVSVGLLAAPVQYRLSVVSTTKTSVAVGSTRYTVSLGSWNLVGTTFTSQWFADGTPIAGTTGATSVVLNDAAYAGQAIEMRLTASKLGYTSSEKLILVRRGTISVATPVAVTDLTAASAPVDALSLLEVGHVLRATPTVTLPPSGATVTPTYVWYRSNTGAAGTFVAIPGATRQDYTVTLADIGKTLQVRVAPVSNKYAIAASAFTPAGRGVARTDLAGGALPTISVVGSTSVGTSHVAAITGAWPVSGVTLSYRWFVCSIGDCADPGAVWTAAVPTAAAAAWVPPVTAAGSSILVQVTAAKAGYESAVVRSAPVELRALTAITAAAPPTITGLLSGHAVVGKPVTAAAGRYDVTSPIRQLQWESCNTDAEDCLHEEDWVPIAGATATTYTPTSTGTQPFLLRVVETMSKGSLEPVSTASAAVEVHLGTLVRTVSPRVVISGSTYSVTAAGTWVPAATSMQYEWFVDGMSVGTGSPITFSSAASQSVTLVATAIRSHYTSSSVTIPVRVGSATTLTSTAITGASFGQTLVAPAPFVYPASSSPAAVYSYQWYSNGIAISKANASTFTPSTAYLGRSITVRVVATSPYYATRVITSPPVVLQKAPAPTGTAAIQGTTGITPGSKLSLAVGGWPTGFTPSFAWQTSPNGTTWTTVATTPTYTLLTTQPGLQVRAIYTLTRLGFTTATVTTTAETVDWLGPLDTTTPPQLVGSGKLGQTLTASPGAWNAAGVVFSYEWMRDGIVIPGITGTTYVPIASAFGTDIQVRVTATRAGFEPATSLSNIVTISEGSAPQVTSAPRISRVGTTLTATSGVWNVDGLSLSFQWSSNGVPILGATGRTYSLAPGDIGTTMSFVVTANRTGYTAGSATVSTPTAVATVASPTFAGATAAVGRALTVNLGTYSVAVPTRTYQWYRCAPALLDCSDTANFTAIPGAITRNYTPVTAGEVLRVTEQAASLPLSPATAWTAPLTVGLGTLAPTVAAKVTVSGSTFTATPGTWIPSGTAANYQWYLDGSPVAGATGQVYTNAETAKAVHVVVTLSRANYATTTVRLVPRIGAKPLVATTPSITGSTFGEMLSAPASPFVYPATASPAATVSYQWFANGVALVGATASTYTPPATLVGRAITVRLISTSPFYATSSAYLTPATVLQPAAAPSGSATLVSTTGLSSPGSTLSAQLTGWTPSGVTTTYLWQTSVDGTTWATVSRAASYLVPATDVLRQVRLTVTVSKAGHQTATTILSGGTVRWPAPIATVAPQITRSGNTLTSSAGTWNTSSLTVSYQWTADGDPIDGATGATYDLDVADAARELGVIVTVSRTGYTPGTATVTFVGSTELL